MICFQPSEGLVSDPIWCSSTCESTSQSAPITASNSSSTTSSETTLLPSFESTYLSYSVVKSPAVVSQLQPLPLSSPPLSLSQEKTNLVQSLESNSNSNDSAPHLLLPSSLPSPSSSASSNIAAAVSSSGCSTSSNSSSSSSASDQSLRSLTDQLSTMRHGFIEK